MTLSYDGSAFAGSQVQTGVRTVQGELEGALASLGFANPRSIFAGRTDTGVHAAGQVAACCDARPEMSDSVVRTALNAILPHDVAVLSVERGPDAFHPRFDARWREYRYRIWSGERQPLARTAVWHRTSPLDVELMAAAANRFVGTRDFAAIAGGGEGVPWSSAKQRPRGTVRTVLTCGCRAIQPWWKPKEGEGRLFEVIVAADGFLPRMVRTMTALIIDAGRRAMPVGAIDEVLAAQDRRLGGGTAPPHGLTLWQIGYNDWSPAYAAL